MSNTDPYECRACGTTQPDGVPAPACPNCGRRMERTRILKNEYPYYWRVRTRLSDRFGQPCRVLARGTMNSALVEFADGYKVVTSRNYFRKIKTPA